MVNFGNFFGARGRVVDPTSERQVSMACKAQGLVFDRATKQCRQPLRRGRASVPGSSVANLRAACKNRGLVLDMNTKECRGSRSRANRTGPTQKEMMSMCKSQGLVFDRATKQCRGRNVRLSGLERAYARNSLFFGSTLPTQHYVPARTFGTPPPTMIGVPDGSFNFVDTKPS